MDPEIFVKAIKLQTSERAASSTIELFNDPPGKTPEPALSALSTWFRGLSQSDQAMVKKAMQESAETAVFGFFCILDGVRAFEDQPSDGRLELYYVNGPRRVLINDPKQEELHNLFNAS
jgi:hypothetical protein